LPLQPAPGFVSQHRGALQLVELVNNRKKNKRRACCGAILGRITGVAALLGRLAFEHPIRGEWRIADTKKPRRGFPPGAHFLSFNFTNILIWGFVSTGRQPKLNTLCAVPARSSDVRYRGKPVTLGTSAIHIILDRSRSASWSQGRGLLPIASPF
jgi:hypothetical protein